MQPCSDAIASFLGVPYTPTDSTPASMAIVVSPAKRIRETPVKRTCPLLQDALCFAFLRAQGLRSCCFDSALVCVQHTLKLGFLLFSESWDAVNDLLDLHRQILRRGKHDLAINLDDVASVFRHQHRVAELLGFDVQALPVGNDDGRVWDVDRVAR